MFYNKAMATFPTAIASFTDPSSSNFLSSPPHATQHANENDEIVAIETKIGINNSADTNSLDYKVNHITAKYLFYIAGSPSIANDLSINPTVPVAQICSTLSAYCKTAPTGSALILEIYNVTQAKIVATLTINAGSQTASTTSMSNASLNAGDVLRIDITQIGSTIAGSGITAVLF